MEWPIYLGTSEEGVSSINMYIVLQPCIVRFKKRALQKDVIDLLDSANFHEKLVILVEMFVRCHYM